jgi:DivIVA domain-containing protein
MANTPAAFGADSVEFDIVVRGYDRMAVDSALEAAHRAAQSDDPAVREAAAQELHKADFPVTLRGYARDQVDTYIATLISERLSTGPERWAAEDSVEVDFATSSRGYSIEEVDALLAQAGAALASKNPSQMSAARAAVQTPKLRVKWFGGYDREQVDHYLADLDRRLAAAQR